MPPLWAARPSPTLHVLTAFGPLWFGLFSQSLWLLVWYSSAALPEKARQLRKWRSVIESLEFHAVEDRLLRWILRQSFQDIMQMYDDVSPIGSCFHANVEPAWTSSFECMYTPIEQRFKKLKQNACAPEWCLIFGSIHSGCPTWCPICIRIIIPVSPRQKVMIWYSYDIHMIFIWYTEVGLLTALLLLIGCGDRSHEAGGLGLYGVVLRNLLPDHFGRKLEWNKKFQKISQKSLNV